MEMAFATACDYMRYNALQSHCRLKRAATSRCWPRSNASSALPVVSRPVCFLRLAALEALRLRGCAEPGLCSRLPPQPHPPPTTDPLPHLPGAATPATPGVLARPHPARARALDLTRRRPRRLSTRSRASLWTPQSRCDGCAMQHMDLDLDLWTWIRSIWPWDACAHPQRMWQPAGSAAYLSAPGGNTRRMTRWLRAVLGGAVVVAGRKG